MNELPMRKSILTSTIVLFLSTLLEGSCDPQKEESHGR